MERMHLTIAAIERVAFSILGWSVHWYGIIIGLGMLMGYFLYTHEANRKGIDSDTSFDILFWAIIIGLLGARLYYVLFSLNQYIANPLSIFFIWQGGMAIYGGVIAGVFTIYYLSQKYRLNFIMVLDIAVPALMVGQVIGRWGNFVNQEAYGGAVPRSFLENLYLPEFMIEQMNINGTYHHPTFLYESVWNFIGLVIILILRRKANFLKRGEIVAFYMMWYGFGRFWIEGLRTDSLYLGPLRISQIVSILLVIAGLGIVYYIRRIGREKIPYYTEDNITTT